MVCYGDHEEEKLTAVVIRFVLLPKFRSELPNHPFTYLQSYCTLFMNHQSHFELKVHEANAGESGLSQNNMPLKNNQITSERLQLLFLNQIYFSLEAYMCCQLVVRDLFRITCNTI
jgi:hypothetical protein